MRNVMTKAWEIAREGQKKFGGKVSEYFAEALRIAWSIVKKGMEKAIEFKGSEKQVAWAKDIYAKVIEYKNWYVDLANNTPFKKEKFKVKSIEVVNEVVESLMKEENAGFWIDRFREITKENFSKKDFMFNLAVYAEMKFGDYHRDTLNMINRKNSFLELQNDRL